MNSRAWKILVVSSLVLNVFLLGGIAGGAYQWFSSHSQAHAPAPEPVALRFAADGLSPERQHEFLDGIKLARRDARLSARMSREERIEVLRLLAAPQFDRAAVEAALTRTREADIAVRVSVEQSVLDFASNLSLAERQTFVDGLTHRGQWRLNAKEQARLQAMPASSTDAASGHASSDGAASSGMSSGATRNGSESRAPANASGDAVSSNVSATE